MTTKRSKLPGLTAKQREVIGALLLHTTSFQQVGARALKVLLGTSPRIVERFEGEDHFLFRLTELGRRAYEASEMKARNLDPLEERLKRLEERVEALSQDVTRHLRRVPLFDSGSF